MRSELCLSLSTKTFNMDNFPIKFVYNNTEFTADILKINITKPGQTVQWHAFKILPRVKDDNEALMFIQVDDGSFQFPIDPNRYPIGFMSTMLSEIQNECEARGINFAS